MSRSGMCLTALMVFALFVAPSQAADNKAQEMPTPKVKVGDMAPDFKLLDQKLTPVSLSDFRGKKNVALAFYVFAFTGG